mgnify:CR=1 FL=1
MVVVVIFVGTALLEKPNPSRDPRILRYSDFIEAIEENQISRVMISPDNGTAQIIENDGSRAEVTLAPDNDLLQLLTEHNVDIAVQPARRANPRSSARHQRALESKNRRGSSFSRSNARLLGKARIAREMEE